jgi:hypothetical protein
MLGYLNILKTISKLIFIIYEFYYFNNFLNLLPYQ